MGRDTNVNAFHSLDQVKTRSKGGQKEACIALGDFQNIYDVCGRLGLCPECRRKGIVSLRHGCQRQYVVGGVRGEVG